MKNLENFVKATREKNNRLHAMLELEPKNARLCAACERIHAALQVATTLQLQVEATIGALESLVHANDG